MSEKKEASNFSMKWEIGLYGLLCLSFYVFPFLTVYRSPVYLFRDSNSIFFGDRFDGLINSYFTVSIVLLFLLPVVASASNYFLEKRGYPFLASLQSLLIFISCFVILLYAVFSLTTQKDGYTMNLGVYLALLIYWLHIYSDLKEIRKMVEIRDSSTEEKHLEK